MIHVESKVKHKCNNWSQHTTEISCPKIQKQHKHHGHIRTPPLAITHPITLPERLHSLVPIHRLPLHQHSPPRPANRAAIPIEPSYAPIALGHHCHRLKDRDCNRITTITGR